jgi:hypothetical protein
MASSVSTTNAARPVEPFQDEIDVDCESTQVFSLFAFYYCNAPCPARVGVPELIQSRLDDVMFFMLLLIEKSVDS